MQSSLFALISTPPCRSSLRSRLPKSKCFTVHLSKWCNTIYEGFFLGRQFIHCLSKQHARSSPLSSDVYSSGQLPANTLPISFTALRGFRKMFSWIEKGSLTPHYPFCLALCLSLSLSPSLSSPILVSTGERESIWLAPLNQRLHCVLARQSRTTLIEVEQKKRGSERRGVRLMERNKHAVVQGSLKLYIL